MPNKFGTLFSKLEQKFEEAKISDLNHELGKWVQGTSTAFVDNFRYFVNSHILRITTPKSVMNAKLCKSAKVWALP